MSNNRAAILQFKDGSVENASVPPDRSYVKWRKPIDYTKIILTRQPEPLAMELVTLNLVDEINGTLIYREVD